MGKMGGFTAADLKKLQKQLNKIQQAMLKRSLMLVQRNLPPAYLPKLSSEHLSGSTRKVQVKKAVHFAGAGLPQPMKKPQAAAEKAMRKHTLIP